jgi:ABC-2 type transport system permease protein
MPKPTHLNVRGGAALIRSTWASWLQYRSFFFLLAFGWMIPPLIYLFVWATAAGGGQVGGLTRAEFVGYYLILILVNQITYAQTNWTVGDVIRSGGMNSWLLRPLPPLYNALSSELAGKVVYLIFVAPVAAVLALLLRPEVHPGPGGAALFALSVVLAWALRFFWGLWIALLAFWAARADALLAVQDALVFLLAGVVAPFALLPPLLQTAARWLPFRYMVGFPVEIMAGKLSPAETLAGLALQAAWAGAAAALSYVIWRAGVRRYSAIGG